MRKNQPFLQENFYFGHAHADLPMGGLEKDDMECGKFYRGFSYVLPICFILEQPHSGQMWMLKFHTAFSSSAIDRSV